MMPAAGRLRVPGRSRPQAAFAARIIAPPVLVLAAWFGVARAQLPYFDPLPFPAPPDSLSYRASQVALTHFGDGRTHWLADRLLVDARLPLGGAGCFLVRLPWLRSDTAALSPAARWPSIVGAEAGPGWPGEAVVSGIGQMELGAAGPLRLPWLGPVAGAVGIGVPLGQGRSYPWSTAGIPVRFGLTRWFGVRSGWWLGAGAVLVLHGGQGGDVLDPAAFPNGWSSTVSLERAGRPLGLHLAWVREDRGGRSQQNLVAEAGLPWTGGHRVGLRAAHEITGATDRAAAWSLGLVWRLQPRVVAAKPARSPNPTRSPNPGGPPRP